VIVVRSCRLSFLNQQLLLIAVAVGAALGGVRVSRAAYLPVYGSPPFMLGVGGYKFDISEEPIATVSYNSIDVNNDGIAIGPLKRVDASGNELDARAIRWSETEAVELGHLGTDTQGFANSVAFDINNAGTSVGGAVVGFNYPYGMRPVRWGVASTAATELDRLGFNSGSWAQAINDSGNAVGIYSIGNSVFTRAALWKATGVEATPLSIPNGFIISEATTINNAGTVIGQVKKPTPDANLAVRWDTPNTATLLGNLGPNILGSTTTTATAISDTGVIAGTSSKHDTSGNLLGTFAVRWDAGGTAATELQNPWSDPTTGQSEAHVTAINADGTIVGYAKRYPGYGYYKEIALRWDPEGTDAIILGNLGTTSTGAYRSAAFDINAAGTIVGYVDSYSPSGNPLGFKAVYWQTDGSAVDLNTFIDPSSGWRLENATAISDTGWIAGHGWFDPDGPGGQPSYPRMFLLQIPEPTFLYSAVIGLLIICRNRWRRA
jgi:uncharacterized membrane protein